MKFIVHRNPNPPPRPAPVEDPTIYNVFGKPISNPFSTERKTPGYRAMYNPARGPVVLPSTEE